jgi:hypothetical protein
LTQSRQIETVGATVANTAILAAVADGTIPTGTTGDIRLDALAAGKRALAVMNGNQSVAATGATAGTPVVVAGPTVFGASMGAVTFNQPDSTANTAAAHGLAVGDSVGFGPITGSAQVTAYAGYFVHSIVSATAFRITKTLGGAAVTMASGSSTDSIKGYPVRVNAWDDLAVPPRVRPEIAVTSTRPVAGPNVAGTYQAVRADQSIVTFAPGVLSGTGMRASTRFDGKRIDVLMRGLTGSKPTTIYVDGMFLRRIGKAELTALGFSDSTMYRIPLTFEDARPRVITVHSSDTSTLLLGFDIEQAFPLKYPATVAKGPRVLISGDSYTEGTGAEVGYVEWLTDLMGWPDVWRGGAGSTGYVTAGTRAALINRW